MMELHTLVFVVLSCNAVIAKESDAGADISKANSKFSGDLYEILAKKEGNLVYSGLSAHAILSLLYQGTTGDGLTTKSFQKALHLSSAQEAAEGYRRLIENLQSSVNVTLNIANKVYLQEQYKLKDEFSSVAKDSFSSEVEKVDFKQSTETAKLINNWVEEKTNEKIKDLIKPGDLGGSTVAVLVNAIYFLGKWQHQFNETHTKAEQFYVSEKDTVKCDIMHNKWAYEYKDDSDLDAQILSIPYKNEDLSLTIILPKSKTGISDLEKKLQSKSWTSIKRGLEMRAIDLSLPKFKIETKTELEDPIVALGLGIIFSGLADFSNMVTDSPPVKVSKAIQKAFIEVDELGTEAAVSTGLVAVTFSAGPLYHRFKADHPFIFAITYKQKDEVLPLFVGRLTKP